MIKVSGSKAINPKNIKNITLRKLTTDETIRLMTLKRLKRAFDYAENKDTQKTLLPDQIKRQLERVWTIPIETLKKLLPNNDKLPAINLFDAYLAFRKKPKNHLLDFLRSTSAS